MWGRNAKISIFFFREKSMSSSEEEWTVVEPHWVKKRDMEAVKAHIKKMRCKYSQVAGFQKMMDTSMEIAALLRSGYRVCAIVTDSSPKDEVQRHFGDSDLHEVKIDNNQWGDRILFRRDV